jgi:predicted DNA-binding protein
MARRRPQTRGRAATTFRIEPQVKGGLEKLSTILKRPLNKLANEALREYVERRIAEVEVDLASTLNDLREYRRSDPNFDRSLSDFVKAEISSGPDPLEGTVVMESDLAKAGPSQQKIQKLLNG